MAANKRHTPWSKKDCEKVRKLWEDGVFASKIAEQLPGRSRCAIIALAKRLKLPNRKQSAKSMAASPTVPKRPKPNILMQQSSTFAQRQQSVQTSASGISFAELQNHQCRYIAGDPRDPQPFCGKSRIEGSPYCISHHRKTHISVPRQSWLRSN